MVRFVGFNRTAALFVGFCCEGLLALFPVSLQLLTYCCPLQLRCSGSVVVFIFTTKFKLEFA